MGFSDRYASGIFKSRKVTSLKHVSFQTESEVSTMAGLCWALWYSVFVACSSQVCLSYLGF